MILPASNNQGSYNNIERIFSFPQFPYCPIPMMHWPDILTVKEKEYSTYVEAVSDIESKVNKLEEVIRELDNWLKDLERQKRILDHGA